MSDLYLDPVTGAYRARALPLSVYDPLYPRSYYHSRYYDSPYHYDSYYYSRVSPYYDPLYAPVDPLYREPLYRDSVYRDSLYRDSLYRDSLYRDSLYRDDLYRASLYREPLYRPLPLPRRSLSPSIRRSMKI